jgi:hypothetical protein
MPGTAADYVIRAMDMAPLLSVTGVSPTYNFATFHSRILIPGRTFDRGTDIHPMSFCAEIWLCRIPI